MHDIVYCCVEHSFVSQVLCVHSHWWADPDDQWIPLDCRNSEKNSEIDSSSGDNLAAPNQRTFSGIERSDNTRAAVMLTFWRSLGASCRWSCREYWSNLKTPTNYPLQGRMGQW